MVHDRYPMKRALESLRAALALSFTVLPLVACEAPVGVTDASRRVADESAPKQLNTPDQVLRALSGVHTVLELFLHSGKRSRPQTINSMVFGSSIVECGESGYRSYDEDAKETAYFDCVEAVFADTLFYVQDGLITEDCDGQGAPTVCTNYSGPFRQAYVVADGGVEMLQDLRLQYAFDVRPISTTVVGKVSSRSWGGKQGEEVTIDVGNLFIYHPGYSPNDDYGLADVEGKLHFRSTESTNCFDGGLQIQTAETLIFLLGVPQAGALRLIDDAERTVDVTFSSNGDFSYEIDGEEERANWSAVESNCEVSFEGEVTGSP